MPGKLYRKLCRKLACQMGKTRKQTHQDKFHRNFKDKVLAWKASKCCGNLFNVASVHSTHTHTHTYTTKQTQTKGQANCLKSHRQSQWPTQQNERRKNEFFGQARIDTKFVCNFQQTGEGGEWERSEQGPDSWTFVALVAILSARQILILKVCHGIPFVCCVYVMRVCVWRHK